MLTTAEHLKRLPFKGYHAQYPFQYVWNFDVGGPDPIVDYPGVFNVDQAANNGYYYALDGALVLKNFDTVNNFFTAVPAFTVGGNLTAVGGWHYMRYCPYSCIELVLEATVSPVLVLFDGMNYRLTIPESYFNANGSWQVGKNHIVFQQGALWLNGVLDTGLSPIFVNEACRVQIYRNSYELTRETKVWSVAFYNAGRAGYGYPQYGYPVWEPDPAYVATSGYRYALYSPTIPVPNPLRLELTP